MSTKTTMHGLPKRKKMVVEKNFSKFFFDYIFYMSLYVGLRLREFLGVSGNENIKTISFLRTQTLYNYMFLLAFFTIVSLHSDLFSAYSHYSRCAVEMR
jgi:mRNA deadenylase 3'-5' endonuclease subunit Ccr4